jgi:hypothetical protein
MAWYNPSTWSPVDRFQDAVKGTRFSAVPTSPYPVASTPQSPAPGGTTTASAPAPAPVAPSGGGTGGSGTTTTSGTGGYTAPALTAEQQLAAQRKAQAEAMRNPLKGLVGSIQGVYDALYGDINVAAADKVAQVQDVYGQDIGDLTAQFNEQFPTIGKAYSARGTGSSSYRFDAEENAKSGFKRTSDSRARVRDQDLATVGSAVAQQQAEVNAQKGLYGSMLATIDASENPDDLMELQTKLNTKIAELQASRAGLQSKASYLNTLNAAVPAGSQLPALRESLTNIIKSQVPGQVKSAIGAQLIQNSGLPQSQVDALLGEFSGQLAQTDKELVAA